MSNNQLTSGKDRVTVPHCGQHINKTKMVEAGGDAAAGGEAAAGGGKAGAGGGEAWEFVNLSIYLYT